MGHRRNFGRRATPQAHAAPIPDKAVEKGHFPLFTEQMQSTLSVEDEIKAWKSARGSLVTFPWRQLSLMAGLCFSIASFVLPATVNDAMQWPLYALAAVSFYMGLAKRKAKAG